MVKLLLGVLQTERLLKTSLTPCVYFPRLGFQLAFGRQKSRTQHTHV